MKLILALLKLWGEMLLGILLLLILIPFGPCVIGGIVAVIFGFNEAIGIGAGLVLQFLGYSLAVLDEDGFFTKGKKT